MFDWRLYQNDQLIEEYLSLNVLDNIYKVDDCLSYNYDDKLVTKKTDEYIVIIDLNNGKMSVKIDSDGIDGELSLHKYEITDNDKELVLIYQVSEEEPVNKIIISRREL